MRRFGSTPTTILLVSLVLGTAAEPAMAGIKCWTNNDGVRECGNVIPPEYAQKAHEEISNQGFIIKETARAKTPEELEAARAAAAKKAEEEKLRKQRETEQMTRDQVLLQTFTTEEDLTLAHKGRMAVIESRVKLTQTHVDKLEANLRDLQTQAAREERSGKPISDNLRGDITHVQRQLEANRGFIAQQREEQQELDAKYGADLKRYKALKSGAVRPGQIDD